MHAKSLQLCPTLCDPVDYVACQAPLSMGVCKLENWSGLRALLQRIFPIQGLNPHLLCFLHWQVGSLPLEPTDKTPIHCDQVSNSQIHNRRVKHRARAGWVGRGVGAGRGKQVLGIYAQGPP